MKGNERAVARRVAAAGTEPKPEWKSESQSKRPVDGRDDVTRTHARTHGRTHHHRARSFPYDGTDVARSTHPGRDLTQTSPHS